MAERMAGPAGLDARIEALGGILDGLGPVALAVSGGVDSMTLAVLAHRRLSAGPEIFGAGMSGPEMFHAVSPAVPPEATERVRDYAAREGWALQVVEAGEFADPNYLANPVNRCYYCKTSLYGTIRPRTGRTILAGTNTDDLGEYRPGLLAAEEHAVRHPYVEAGIDKATVRAIARHLGLADLAELPAAPCLASRVETGIGIAADTLALIHSVERFVARQLQPKTVRCRVRAEGVVVELDAATLAVQEPGRLDRLGRIVARMFAEEGQELPVRFSGYRTGSAFLVDAGAGHVA